MQVSDLDTETNLSDRDAALGFENERKLRLLAAGYRIRRTETELEREHGRKGKERQRGREKESDPEEKTPKPAEIGQAKQPGSAEHQQIKQDDKKHIT